MSNGVCIACPVESMYMHKVQSHNVALAPIAAPRQDNTWRAKAGSRSMLARQVMLCLSFCPSTASYAWTSMLGAHGSVQAKLSAAHKAQRAPSLAPSCCFVRPAAESQSGMLRENIISALTDNPTCRCPAPGLRWAQVLAGHWYFCRFQTMGRLEAQAP